MHPKQLNSSNTDLSDGGPGAFSQVSGLGLSAGDYTIVVGAFNTIFTDDIANITAGTGANSTGDYALNVSFTANAIPEPTSMGLLALAGLGCMVRRRR